MKMKFIFLCVVTVFTGKIYSQTYSYKDYSTETTIKEIVDFIRENTNRFDLMSLQKFDTLVIDEIKTAKGFDFENFEPIKSKVDETKSQVTYSLYKSKDKIVRITKTNLKSGMNLDYNVLHGKGYKVLVASRSESQSLLIKEAPKEIIGFFVQFEETEKCIFVETKISFVGEYPEKIHVGEISSIMTLNSGLDVDNVLLFSNSKLTCLGKVNIEADGGLCLLARFYSDNNLYSGRGNCSKYGDLEKLKIGKLWHLTYRDQYHCNSYLVAKLSLNNNSLDIWDKGLSIR